MAAQVELRFKSTWGGARPGAGRPRGTRTSTRMPHVRRPPVSRHRPHHITIRTTRGTWNLRAQRTYCFIVAALAGSSYQDAIAIISHPLVAIILILAVISVANHMRLGMQIVIEDYVHDKGLKIIAVMANNFYAVIIGVACLYAILKVSLGRILV